MISDARGHSIEVTVRPLETEPVGGLPLAAHEIGEVGIAPTFYSPAPYTGGTLHPVAVLAEVYAEGGSPVKGKGVPPEGLQDEGQAAHAGVGTTARAVDSRGYALEVRAVAPGARAEDGSTRHVKEDNTAIGLFRKSNRPIGTRQQAVDSRGFPVQVRAADGENAVRDVHGTPLDQGLEDAGRGLQVTGIDIGRVRLAGDAGRSLQDAPVDLRLDRPSTRDDGNWLFGKRAVYSREASAVSLSLLDAAPYPRTDSAAVRAALATCCGSSRWVAHMLRSMPFIEAANLYDAAELGWWVSSR